MIRTVGAMSRMANHTLVGSRSRLPAAQSGSRRRPFGSASGSGGGVSGVSTSVDAQADLTCCPTIGILELVFADVLLERQRREHRGRRVDQRVVEDVLVDVRLRGLVRAAVVHVVRERGADLGLEDVVHERFRVLRVLGALRDRHRVDPRERTRGGDHVLDVLVVGLDREDVARVGLRHHQLAALQRVLVVGRDLLDRLLELDQVVPGRVEVVVVRGVRDPSSGRTAPSRTRRAPRRGTTTCPSPPGA